MRTTPEIHKTNTAGKKVRKQNQLTELRNGGGAKRLCFVSVFKVVQ